MTKNDRAQFAELWVAAYAVYGKTVSDGMLDVVFSALSSYSLQDIRRGLSGHVKNPDSGQFPPKPADVIKHIDGNSQSAAGEAWAKVDYGVRCVGHYRSVVFDDPKIHAAIERLGGWVKLASDDGKEYPYLKNHFLKLYQGFTVQPPESFPRKLTGACEHQNSQISHFARGKADNEPVLIGNKEKARQVYLGGSEQGVAQITQSGTKAFLDTAIDEQVKRLKGGAA